MIFEHLLSVLVLNGLSEIVIVRDINNSPNHYNWVFRLGFNEYSEIRFSNKIKHFLMLLTVQKIKFIGNDFDSLEETDEYIV